MNFITKAPVMLCGGDYNPDQWLDRPDILEADIRMMKKAGMNSVTLGVFAWAAYEPREGEYNFTWLREIMDRLYDQGIYTELATPTGAKPNWLARKYPEVLRVQSNGVRDHQGMRHNHCLTSPIYRQKVEELLNHLIDAVGDHPGLILWHISNELGGECYCPLCQERFRGWLKEKYHTSSLLGLGISFLCLLVFGPDSFMIPTMILIIVSLTLLRKKLDIPDQKSYSRHHFDKCASEKMK